jgi:hypothetical protein
VCVCVCVARPEALTKCLSFLFWCGGPTASLSQRTPPRSPISRRNCYLSSNTSSRKTSLVRIVRTFRFLSCFAYPPFLPEFLPFVFQLISLLVELHPGTLPDLYKSLMEPMLHGSLWLSRGNVPPLIRLLRAFLAKSSGEIVAANQLPAIRDIFRFLTEGKVHDQYSYEVLEALFEFVPTSVFFSLFSHIGDIGACG